jgi:hypothetical protein
MTVRAHARHVRRAAVAAALALAVLGATGPAAHADTVTKQRSVVAEWMQLGAVPQAAGNVHVGRVQVWGTPGSHEVDSLYGETLDYTCPSGFVPDGLWLDAIAELDATCTLEDNLIIESGDLDLRVQGTLRSARLTGALGYIHGYAVGSPGSLPVDLRWDAPGTKTVDRQVVGTRPRTIVVTTTREASVTGTVGTTAVGPGDGTSAGEVMRIKTIQRG